VKRALLVLLASCQANLDASRDPVALDRPFFDCRVQPVLTKLCSQLACHGTTQRFFHVFARNRLRLDANESGRNAFLTENERAANYRAATALVDGEDSARSYLLRKPLAQGEGGAFHIPQRLFGGADVFETAEDRDYQTLVEWIDGATEAANCVEPGSDL